MITSLKPHQVFVFGSNLAGVHGKGAAVWARRFGAKFGQGVGRAGQTYAIPTKNLKLKTLPLSDILNYVSEFLAYARMHMGEEFLVTEVGCGLAGYKPSDIGPTFRGCSPNVKLPDSFK